MAMHDTVEAPGQVPELKRSLGLTDVSLFFVVAASNLQWVATAAAAGPTSLVVWVIGGFAMFVPLSICVVFLTSRHPEEGGMYVWSKRAFGPFAAFFTGWTYWTSNLPYFPTLLYFAAGNALFVTGGNGGALATSAWYFIAFALSGLALSTILNILGLDIGKWLNNIGAASRWIVTLLLIGFGIAVWWKFGPATPMPASALRPSVRFADIIFWSTIAFAWTGPEAISFMSGEVRNPRRSIPLGLAFAAPAIAVIYILGTWAVMVAFPSSNVDASAGVMQAIAAAATRFQWSIVTPVAAMLVAISCLGSCGAWLGAVARIPFVAGIDRYLPPAFGIMHPRWGSPVAALLTQSTIAAVFVLLGQAGETVKNAYTILVNATVLITMLPFLLLFASALKLNDVTATGDMIAIPGGRYTIIVAACIGFLTTLGAAILSFFPPDGTTDKLSFVLKIIVMTAFVVGTGTLVYVLGKRRAARQ